MNAMQCLDRLDELNRRFGEVAARGGAGESAQVLTLRHDFASECGNLLLAITQDDSIRGNRELFDAMQEGLDLIRSRNTAHQLRWQKRQIEDDPTGYHKAAESLNKAVCDYIADARGALTDLRPEAA